MSGPRTISVVDFGSYLPENEVDLTFFFGEEGNTSPLAKHPVLRPPDVRRHVAPDERAADMIERAARPLLERVGRTPEEGVDLILTNVLLPDELITGSGTEVAQRLGCAPEWVLDVHNGGCASFPYMLKLASSLMQAPGIDTALVCNVQNTAGQVFSQSEVRERSHAIAAGDGCGVAYLEVGDRAPLLGVRTRLEPLASADMRLAAPDGRKFWEPGTGQIDIEFTASESKEIINRGNTLVPEVVAALCEEIGVTPADIDVLVTNQPNRLFLRNWRKALGVEPERHLDTFDSYGNLYGAGVSVTLAGAAREGKLRAGDLVVVAGFAHAGDFAAAAAFRWGAAT